VPDLANPGVAASIDTTKSWRDAVPFLLRTADHLVAPGMGACVVGSNVDPDPPGIQIEVVRKNKWECYE
jgi:hypothetical protein